MLTEKEVPHDAYTAFYEGFELADNPWPEFDGRWEEWERDWMEAYKNYKQEGRFRDGTFKG